MSWLISQKVLPALIIGDPPNYRTIVDAKKNNPMVGWTLTLNDRDIGWVFSEIQQLDNGMTEIVSYVHLEHVPAAELASTLLKFFSDLLKVQVSDISIDMQSNLQIDPLGKITRFESAIHTGFVSEAIRIQGMVNGSQMNVTIDFKEFTTSKSIFLPQNALMSDALSPQSQLPNLREGQSWTVPSFSPLRAEPMEIQLAKVEGREIITWNDELLDAWLVVYRSDPGQGLKKSQPPLDKLWVTDDGRVLRQQAQVFDSKMTFTRMTDLKARELSLKIKDENSGDRTRDDDRENVPGAP
jgi:hypothetical protein